METLISKLMEGLPKIMEAIGLLKKVPEAVGTVKDLIAYVNSTIQHLRQVKPWTADAEKQFDTWLDSLPDEDYWQPEKA